MPRMKTEPRQSLIVPDGTWTLSPLAAIVSDASPLEAASAPARARVSVAVHVALPGRRASRRSAPPRSTAPQHARQHGDDAPSAGPRNTHRSAITKFTRLITRDRDDVGGKRRPSEHAGEQRHQRGVARDRRQAVGQLKPGEAARRVARPIAPGPPRVPRESCGRRRVRRRPASPAARSSAPAASAARGR